MDNSRYTAVMEVGGIKYFFPFVYIPKKPWRPGEMGLGVDVLLVGAGAPAEKQTFPGGLKQQVRWHGCLAVISLTSCTHNGPPRQ